MKLYKDQQEYIIELVKMEFESGQHIYKDANDIKCALEEGELFANSINKAIGLYFELLDLGPRGFYEEYPNLDWDEDFIAEFGY